MDKENKNNQENQEKQETDRSQNSSESARKTEYSTNDEEEIQTEQDINLDIKTEPNQNVNLIEDKEEKSWDEKIVDKLFKFYNDCKKCLDDETINLRNKEVRPMGGLCQGPLDGLVCSRKLTNKQQIFISTLLLLSIFYVFAITIDGECASDSADFCMDFINTHIITWLTKLFSTSFLIIITFMLSYKRVIPRVTILYLVILVLYLTFGLYEFELQKVSVTNFGPGLAIGLLIVLLISIFITSILYFAKFLYQHHKFVGGAIVLGFLALIALFFIKAGPSCDGWEQGLHGELDFSAPYCSINKPDICYPVMFDNWFNFSPDQCPQNKFDKIQLLETYKFFNATDLSQEELDIIRNDEQYNYLAQPMTTHFSEKDRVFDVIQANVIANSKPYATLEEAFEEHEIVIGAKEEGLFVNVQRNETLVEQRKQELESAEEPVESIADNIIVIYIDTLSRPQAHRKLNKTMEFLKDFTGQDTQEELFEFYRFHALDKMTRNNMMTLHFEELYDDIYDNIEEYREKYSENPKNNLMKDFKEAGYIVGHSANTCTSGCLFRSQYADIRELFNEEPGDHEMTMWDPNYINENNYYDFKQGPNAYTRRCLYGDDTSKYVFDYGLSFMDAYKTEKKVLYMEFTDSHEFTSEVVQYMDDHIVDFLTAAKQNGHLNEETVIHFLSDHGQHIVEVFFSIEKVVKPDDWKKAAENPDKSYTNNVYHVERMLPVNMMIMNQQKFKQYPLIKKALKENQQVVFGQREMRHTLLATAYGLKHSKVQENNLYNYLEKDNDCRDLHMWGGLHHAQFCICRPDLHCETNDEKCLDKNNNNLPLVDSN